MRNKVPVLKILLLFVIYFAAARLGLAVNAVSGFATQVWAPAGIALAALLLYGPNLWPGITLGAFAINLAKGAAFTTAFGISIGNTLEALTAAFILRRFFNFENTLGRLKDVAGLFLLAAPVGA